MRKLVLFLTLLSCLGLTAYAEGYSEDFSGYNYNYVLNSEELKIVYDDEVVDTLKASNKLIINGPGGTVYGDSESYTANAAENIFCYTKTGDDTVKPVLGGLNNGWRGYYSHPQTSWKVKDSGAEAEQNDYNRRLAVVATKNEPVLMFNPSNKSATFCVYAKDDVEFYENTKWSSDVRVVSIGEGCSYNLSLTKGKIIKVKPHTTIDKVENDGRDEIIDAIKFGGDSRVYCFGEETVEYAIKTWYTVEVLLKSTEDDTLVDVIITNRDSGEVLLSKKDIALNKKVNVDIDGLSYGAFVKKDSTATKIYMDNVSVEKVELVATLATTREASINGRGNVAISFNSAYLDETINDTNIQLYYGETLIEGYSVSVLSNNRVKIDLPVLKPATVYTIRVNGVVDEYGIAADCEVLFKTVSLSSLANSSISGTDVAFKLKNNSLESEPVYIMAVCENDENMIENIYYKKILVASGDNECSFEGIVEDTTDSVYLYVVDNLLTGVKPLTDFVKINN